MEVGGLQSFQTLKPSNLNVWRMNREKPQDMRFTSKVNYEKNATLTILKAYANECNMLDNMLHLFVHHVGLCCMMLAYVTSSLKPVKLFAQHMPTFPVFSGDR